MASKLLEVFAGIVLSTAAYASNHGLPISILNKINDIEYISDSLNYGTEEYHATMEETLESMSGDCEDIANVVFEMLERGGYNPLYLLVGNFSEDYLEDPLAAPAGYKDLHAMVVFIEEGKWSSIEQGVFRSGYDSLEDIAEASGYNAYRTTHSLSDIPAALFPVEQ